MEPTDSGAVTRLLPADCLAIEEIGASGRNLQATLERTKSENSISSNECSWSSIAEKE
jgi:hypothetical protein